MAIGSFDRAILPVNLKFRSLVTADLPPDLLGLHLGALDVTSSFPAVPLHLPSTLVRHYSVGVSRHIIRLLTLVEDQPKMASGCSPQPLETGHSCVTAPLLSLQKWHLRSQIKQDEDEALANTMAKDRGHIWNFYGQILAAVVAAIAAIVVAIIGVKYATDPRADQVQAPPSISSSNETASVPDNAAPVAENARPADPAPTAGPTRESSSAVARPREPERLTKAEPRPREVAPAPVTVPPQTIIKQACVIQNSTIDQPTTQDCTGVSQ